MFEIYDKDNMKDEAFKNNNDELPMYKEIYKKLSKYENVGLDPEESQVD